MFRIEYETPFRKGWLHTEYWRPEEADQIAYQLITTADGDITRVAVVEQAGYVYSERVL